MARCPLSKLAWGPMSYVHCAIGRGFSCTWFQSLSPSPRSLSPSPAYWWHQNSSRHIWALLRKMLSRGPIWFGFMRCMCVVWRHICVQLSHCWLSWPRKGCQGPPCHSWDSPGSTWPWRLKVGQGQERGHKAPAAWNRNSHYHGKERTSHGGQSRWRSPLRRSAPEDLSRGHKGPERGGDLPRAQLQELLGLPGPQASPVLTTQ